MTTRIVNRSGFSGVVLPRFRGVGILESVVPESQSNGAVVVSEAILKLNDLTQPDTGQHSLTRVPFHDHVVQRQISEDSGI